MLDDASSPDPAGSINMQSDMLDDANTLGAAQLRHVRTAMLEDSSPGGPAQFGHLRTAVVCSNATIGSTLSSGDTEVPFSAIRSAVLEVDDNSGSRKRSLVQRLGASM